MTTSYNRCQSYALVIEVGSTEHEDMVEVIELVLKLKDLVNDHTLRTAFFDDGHYVIDDSPITI